MTEESIKIETPESKFTNPGLEAFVGRWLVQCIMVEGEWVIRFRAHTASPWYVIEEGNHFAHGTSFATVCKTLAAVP
jgi:hypothetical protein